jgi:alpha-glucosidase (family GH31 glycosyl hydrolase)
LTIFRFLSALALSPSKALILPLPKGNAVDLKRQMNCAGVKWAMLVPALLISLWASQALAQIGNYASHATSGRSVVITGAAPYGDYMVRVQAIKKGETFYADDRYEIVASHDWTGTLTVVDSDASVALSTTAADGISLSIAKKPLRLSFSLKGQNEPLLSEKDGVTWSGNTVTESFTPTTDEHFAGLGHETYGRIPKLDRKGTSLKVSKASEGVCIVPFYLSSRGYGVLLNTTFTHTINLGQNNAYSLNIDGEGYGGQMDYFFIAGPTLTQVVDRYTQLSGNAVRLRN